MPFRSFVSSLSVLSVRAVLFVLLLQLTAQAAPRAPDEEDDGPSSASAAPAMPRDDANTPPEQLRFPAAPGAYRRVDDYVFNALRGSGPEHRALVEASHDMVDSLSAIQKVLNVPTRNTRERIRAYYRYLLETHAYKTSRYNLPDLGRGRRYNPESRATCSEIAGAMRRMLIALEIEARIMEGDARFFAAQWTGDYCEETSEPSEGHAWVVVLLDDEPYIIDPTPALAARQADGRPDPVVADQYFLMPLAAARVGYALGLGAGLSGQVSPYVRPGFFALGLAFQSPKSCVIRVARRFTATLSAPAGVTVSGTLTPTVRDPFGQPSLAPVQVSRSGGQITVTVDLPRAGAYFLALSGARAGDPHSGPVAVLRVYGQ